MSLHPFKRRPTEEAPAAEVPLHLPDALEQLRHWARVLPLHNALCHKRQGRWYAWRWIDALRQVERLADGLRQQGLGEHSRLALCGLFEPDLLLLALAARSLGAQVLSVADRQSPRAPEPCARPCGACNRATSSSTVAGSYWPGSPPPHVARPRSC